MEFWRNERELTYGYVGEQSRWLTASLLVVNSGALFGLLNAKVGADVTNWGGFFVAGKCQRFCPAFRTGARAA